MAKPLTSSHLFTHAPTDHDDLEVNTNVDTLRLEFCLFTLCESAVISMQVGAGCGTASALFNSLNSSCEDCTSLLGVLMLPPNVSLHKYLVHSH
jgi:hypothetical protein